ncbi:MAG: hypothetical protein KY394_04420, partial [Actinobacteria bacterium]|nr:hypothetical protein [Actinomycetota bacterium]
HVGSAHPLSLSDVYREDEVTPSLDREEVLARAPEAVDGYFAAPPAMEVQ